MAWTCDELIQDGGGGVGADWDNLAEFEGDHDGDATSNGNNCQARIKGNLPENGNQYWDGWQSGQNATTRIIIKADSGCETDGTAGAGTDARFNQGLLIQESDTWYFNMHGLEFLDDARIHYNGSGGGEIVATKCFHNDPDKPFISIANGAGTLTLNVGGCLIIQSTNYQDCITLDDADTTANIVNCTLVEVNSAEGLDCIAGANVTVKNCAFADNATDRSNVDTETTSLFEDDATLDHIDASDFTEPSTNDYTIYDTNSELYWGVNAGTQENASWFTTWCATDLAGTTWHNAPSIGCFEYVAAGGNVEVSATCDALILTEYSATVNAETNVEAGVDALVITENVADVNLNVSVSAGVDALILTEQSADVNLNVSVSAGIDALILTEYGVTVNAEIMIAAGLDALILSEYAANVDDGLAVATRPRRGLLLGIYP